MGFKASLLAVIIPKMINISGTSPNKNNITPEEEKTFAINPSIIFRITPKMKMPILCPR